MNISIGHDYRRELQAHAEIFERDGHGREARARLHDRKRELTTGEKARLLAIHRDQIGLGQDLKQILGLKRLDGGSEINVGSKQKEV